MNHRQKGFAVDRTAQNHRRKFIQQKIMGFCLILISAAIVWMASKGTTVEERDCTAVLIILPMGLALLFSKSILIV